MKFMATIILGGLVLTGCGGSTGSSGGGEAPAALATPTPTVSASATPTPSSATAALVYPEGYYIQSYVTTTSASGTTKYTPSASTFKLQIKFISQDQYGIQTYSVIQSGAVTYPTDPSQIGGCVSSCSYKCIAGSESASISVVAGEITNVKSTSDNSTDCYLQLFELTNLKTFKLNSAGGFSYTVPSGSRIWEIGFDKY